VQIIFAADRLHLQAGECTNLRWDVEHVKAVYLDGQGVTGHESRQVCPAAATTYVLHVVYDGGTTDRQLTIQVTGGGSPPSLQPGGSVADLAVTDLFPDNLPQGNVWVRVTNNGPATLSNTQIEMKCNSHGTPLSNIPPWSHVEAPWQHTVSLQPGQTATFQTHMTVDTGKYAYDAKCTAVPPSQGATFSDPNWSNNAYSEQIASPSSPPAPPGGGSWGILTTDVAVTDLYPDNLPTGKLFTRVTNNGPADLSIIGVQLVCQGGGWSGNQLTTFGGNQAMNLNLKSGQTAAYDTGMAIDTNQYQYYEMTCSIVVGFKDDQPANNIYSERIP